MDRAQWLAERKHGLGSSDSAAVCRQSPWRTPLHVYLDKVGELPDQDSDAKAWGRRREVVVAQAYQEETGRPVYKPARMVEKHKTLPWMLASLDRLTEVGGKGRVLECKTARRDDDDWGTPGTDEVPGYYLLQCQHQLAVTGMEACDLAVLIAGQEFRVYTIERDDRLIDRMQYILSDFWGMVQRREPPKPDWTHAETVNLIKKMQRVDPDKQIELGDDAVPDILRYLEAKRNEANWRATKELHQGRLLYAMGDARVALSPCGHILKRSPVSVKEHTVEAFDYFKFTVKEPK